MLILLLYTKVQRQLGKNFAVKYEILIAEFLGLISINNTKITVLDAKNRLINLFIANFDPQTINNWDDLNMAGPYSIREENHHGRGNEIENYFIVIV